jgi:hypothetical protein
MSPQRRDERSQTIPLRETKASGEDECNQEEGYVLLGWSLTNHQSTSKFMSSNTPFTINFNAPPKKQKRRNYLMGKEGVLLTFGCLIRTIPVNCSGLCPDLGLFWAGPIEYLFWSICLLRRIIFQPNARVLRLSHAHVCIVLPFNFIYGISVRESCRAGHVTGRGCVSNIDRSRACAAVLMNTLPFIGNLAGRNLSLPTPVAGAGLR